MYNLSHENESYLHIKGCTRLALKNEVQDNSEMACWVFRNVGFYERRRAEGPQKTLLSRDKNRQQFCSR